MTRICSILTSQKNDIVLDVHEAMQTSILNWGRVLIVTGGTLKPSKYFYHLISFSWKPYGSWRYDKNEKKPELSIMVPLSDGSHAPTEHLAMTAPTKTLGSMTCPTGCSTRAITQMVEKAQGWIDRARSGKLHKCNLWFLLDKQFWPKVSFSISSITAPFDVLEECLMKTYFSMLSLSGVHQSVSRELCQMDCGFYGALSWECWFFECPKMVELTDTCVSARHVADMSADMSATQPKMVSAKVLTMLSRHVVYGYVGNMLAL
jgi:hypothetical protein